MPADRQAKGIRAVSACRPVYLDDELLIVRDDSGLPNVLRRQPKFPTASEPSYDVVEDDSAPGAG